MRLRPRGRFVVMSDEWKAYHAWLRKWGNRVAIVVLAVTAWITWHFIRDQRAADARQDWYREIGSDPRVTTCVDSLGVHPRDSVVFYIRGCLTGTHGMPLDTARRIEAFWHNIQR